MWQVLLLGVQHFIFIRGSVLESNLTDVLRVPHSLATAQISKFTKEYTLERNLTTVKYVGVLYQKLNTLSSLVNKYIKEPSLTDVENRASSLGRTHIYKDITKFIQDRNLGM